VCRLPILPILLQATALFLSLPSTPLDGAAQIHRELVRSICGLLLDQVEQVAQSARQALARLRLSIGEGEFAACLRALPSALRTAYEQPDGTEVGASSDIDNPNHPGALEFGFVNARLMSALREVGNWQVRAQAIAELQTLFATLSADMFPRIEPHLAAFTDLLTTFLEDANFKISLTSLQMLSDLLDRFAEQIRSGPDSERVFLAIVPRLMDKFGDNKIVIRQANFRLTKKLMGIVPPDRALRSLLGYAQHQSSHIREQAISVLIQTLLGAPRQPPELCRTALIALSAPIADTKPKVRQAALEAAAVLHEMTGAAVFEGILLELQLGDDKTTRIMERVRQGRAALPTLSADGLVEFTMQPGIGTATANAAPPLARPPSAGRDRGSGTALGGGVGGGSACSSCCGSMNGDSATGGGGIAAGGGGGGALPPTAEEPSPPQTQPIPRAIVQQTAGSDYSDLLEFTAGGRRIATSKGRLPWETTGRDGVASRGKPGPRAAPPPLLEVAHEGEGSSEHEMPPTSLSARDTRAIRIEVPAAHCASGPLSAPSYLHAHGGGGAHWGEDGDGLPLRVTPSPSMAGLSDVSPMDREQKIQLWLPERIGADGAPSMSAPRPTASRRAQAGGASGGGDSLSSSFDSVGGDVGPRDSLKLIKRRQQSFASAPAATSGSALDGAPMSAAPSAASAGGPRAVSATGRAPQVRLPFEERQRSSSAPHKRNDGAGPSLPDPNERLEEGMRAIEEAHAQGSTGVAGTGVAGTGVAGTGVAGVGLSGAGIAGRIATLGVVAEGGGLRLGAASLGECGAMGADDASRANAHTGAYPSRRSTTLLRARCGATGGLAAGAAEAPGVAPLARGSVVRRSGELNLQLDGVAVARGGVSMDDEGSARKGGSSMSGRVASAAPVSEPPLLTGADGNAVKMLEELRTEDLKGLPALPPESTMRTVLELLRSDDWGAHFDSINLLRRLVAWADESGNDGGLLSHLHSINLLLIQYADSLRSSLAKNAVVCFRELFCYLGTKIEADLDLIVPVLIKKAGESNGFICDEANKALTMMVHNVSESRAITALLTSWSHRNPSARAKAATHLAKALEVMGYDRVLQSRELDRVLPILPTMLGEGLSETRAAAKHIIAGLTREARHSPADSERLERLLRRNLSEPAYRKLRDSVDMMQHPDPNSLLADGLKMSGGPAIRNKEGRRGGAVGSSANAPASAAAEGGRRGGGGGGGSSNLDDLGGVSGSRFGSKGSGGVGGSGDLSELEDAFKSLASTDWSTRIEGVMSLAELVTEQPETLGTRANLLTMFDHLTPRLTDSNSKVIIVALQKLQEMVPLICDGLPSVVATLVPALGTSLASSNAQVRAIVPAVIDTLVKEVAHDALMQPFANCVLYSPPKARPMMIDKLRELSTSVYAAKPQLVIKHVLPTAWRLLEDNRADLRTNTVQLLRILHVLLGPALLEHAQTTPAAVQRRLQEIVQTL